MRLALEILSLVSLVSYVASEPYGPQDCMPDPSYSSHGRLLASNSDGGFSVTRASSSAVSRGDTVVLRLAAPSGRSFIGFRSGGTFLELQPSPSYGDNTNFLGYCTADSTWQSGHTTAAARTSVDLTLKVPDDAPAGDSLTVTVDTTVLQSSPRGWYRFSTSLQIPLTGSSSGAPSPPPPAAEEAPVVTVDTPAVGTATKCGIVVADGYLCGIRITSEFSLGFNMPSDLAANARDSAHFVLVSRAGDGYLGIGATGSKASMVPARLHIILPSATASLSGASVQVHDVTDKKVSSATFQATPTSSVQRTLKAASSSGATVYSFSIPFGEGPHPLSATGENNMIWAIGSSRALVEHKSEGGLQLNFETGEASLSDSGIVTLQKAHGGLMIAAIMFLFPSAAVFGILKKKLTKDSSVMGLETWFQIHRGLVTLAIMTAFSGWVIALAKFDTLDQTEPVNFRHAVLGLILMSFAFIQIFIGVIRPAKTAPRRPVWKLIHRLTGIIIVLVLTPVVVFSGCKAYENSTSEEDAVAFWVASAVIGGVTLLLVAGSFIFVALRPHEARPLPPHPEGSREPIKSSQVELVGISNGHAHV